MNVLYYVENFKVRIEKIWAVRCRQAETIKSGNNVSYERSQFVKVKEEVKKT